MDYYINKKISTDFDQAVVLVTEALKSEGFGVLSEIDIQQKLKEKLDGLLHPFNLSLFQLYSRSVLDKRSLEIDKDQTP